MIEIVGGPWDKCCPHSRSDSQSYRDTNCPDRFLNFARAFDGGRIDPIHTLRYSPRNVSLREAINSDTFCPCEHLRCRLVVRRNEDVTGEKKKIDQSMNFKRFRNTIVSTYRITMASILPLIVVGVMSYLFLMGITPSTATGRRLSYFLRHRKQCWRISLSYRR